MDVSNNASLKSEKVKKEVNINLLQVYAFADNEARTHHGDKYISIHAHENIHQWKPKKVD